jgi:hypothetical protein
MEVAMRNNVAARIGTIAVPALLCAVAVGTAYAQPRTCMPHDGAGDKLRSEFGEKIVGHGVSSDGTLLEIYLAPSGTFTVIKTTPAGLSCVVDFGEGWQTLNQLEHVGFTPETLKSMPGPRSH